MDNVAFAQPKPKLASSASVERIWDRDRVAELRALRVVLGLPRRLSTD